MTCTSPAPCASRPSSTSPTPSTSTGPSPTVPRPKALGSTESLDARRAEGPRRPRPYPDRPRPRRVPGRRREPTRTCPPHGRSCSTPTSTRHWTSWRPSSVHRADGGGPAAGPARPGQDLVRRLPDQGHDQAGHRPQRPAVDPAYEVPDRIREQVILRDRTCVFPWCTRPARGCDIDHVDEYDHHAEAEGRPQPGPTQTANLAALCGFHHASRPTPPGVTGSSPASSSGPPRTDTATDATARHDRGRPGRATDPPTSTPTMTPPRTPPPSGSGATGMSSGVEFGGSPGQCTNSTSTVAIVL